MGSDLSVDECLNVFYKILNDKIVETIPQTSVTVRPNDRPGMTREVRLLFRNTHRLYRIAKRTKNEFDIE